MIESVVKACEGNFKKPRRILIDIKPPSACSLFATVHQFPNDIAGVLVSNLSARQGDAGIVFDAAAVIY
jgi:hypothetical protein